MPGVSKCLTRADTDAEERQDTQHLPKETLGVGAVGLRKAGLLRLVRIVEVATFRFLRTEEERVL